MARVETFLGIDVPLLAAQIDVAAARRDASAVMALTAQLTAASKAHLADIKTVVALRGSRP